jgi:hypothetical protein
VELKSQKKKFQGAPVEAIPEDTTDSPHLVDGCAVFRAASRWMLRLQDWFVQGLETFQRCTLREPTTVPECWKDRLEHMHSRSLSEAKEDLLREELTWLYAVRNQCEEDGIRRLLEAKPEVHPFLPSDYRSYGAVEKLQFNIMTMRTMMGWVSPTAECPCEAVPTVTEDGLYSTYEWWYSADDPLWGGPGVLDRLHRLMVQYPPKDREEWVNLYARTMGRMFWRLNLWDRMTWWHLAEIYVMPDGRLVPTWDHRRMLAEAVQRLDRQDDDPDAVFRSELRARGHPLEVDQWNLTHIQAPDPRRILDLVSYYRHQIYHDVETCLGLVTLGRSTTKTSIGPADFLLCHMSWRL